MQIKTSTRIQLIGKVRMVESTLKYPLPFFITEGKEKGERVPYLFIRID